MHNRPYSKTTPLTDLIKPKTRYGENSPAHIIQKARSEVNNDTKSTTQHISKPKLLKSSDSSHYPLTCFIRRELDTRYQHENRKRRLKRQQISE